MKSSRPWRYTSALTIDESRFVEADPAKQNYTVVPESCYFAMQMECELCKTAFWFSENEQKYWYEELGFWIDSVPKACPNCRKSLRTSRASA